MLKTSKYLHFWSRHLRFFLEKDLSEILGKFPEKHSTTENYSEITPHKLKELLP